MLESGSMQFVGLIYVNVFVAKKSGITLTLNDSKWKEKNRIKANANEKKV